MRRAWVDAERVAEVRDAARSWRKAGAIDEATLAAIEAEFPGPRLELAPAWRVLIFVLVSVAAVGVQVGIFGFNGKASGRFFVYAGILAAATEILRGSRLSGTGSDAGTSLWAVIFLTVGFAVLLQDDRAALTATLTATLAVAAAAFAAACWRWGFAIYGAFAAALAFLVLARFPSGRLGWAVAGAVVSPLALRLADRPRFAPSRRRAFAGVFVVSALAFYAAVNLYSFDKRTVERFETWPGMQGVTAATAARLLFAVATALVPIAFIVWGLRARRRLVLDTGAILAALSVLTVEYYVRFGSVAITAFGLALIGLALWLNRRLRQAPGEEIRGFTASPLLSPESGNLSPAAALAAAATVPVSSHPTDDADFSAGGGKYGGGGATGTF